MNTVKDLLDRMRSELQNFEAVLRGALANQNIADIVASASGKLAQAADHADAATELSKLPAPVNQEPKPAEVEQEGFQFPGGNPAG